ncbi:uncharacterized protein LOC131641210 [Vicia villosa]|uniref:uncharacterized protein LOC131641210 n=1 Tax=Vicia villosa TaxID=3911 RepID=UPI00273B0791|nr:uncharacterized protein LOC131641210 [Vicia villosa]
MTASIIKNIGPRKIIIKKTCPTLCSISDSIEEPIFAGLLGVSEVGRKVWSAISRLGVVSEKEDGEVEKDVEILEKRDKEISLETKYECFNDSLARDFWGVKEVEWTSSNSVGAAGEMVILWKKGALTVNHSFRGKGFVGINIFWKGNSYNLVNVYAPCSRRERSSVWSDLLSLKNRRGNEEWCIAGDFNEVLNKEEREGVCSTRERRGMGEFDSFVENMELIDVNCVGGRFTWFKDNGKAMSRLDRFLVTRNMMDIWEVIDQRIDKRDISDHTPIRLNVGKVDLGPKPFRFNNVWKGDFVLYEKLKILRGKLRVWNREVFGWIDLKVEEEVDKMNELDRLMVDNLGGDIEDLVVERREVGKDIRHSLNVKEAMLRKKSQSL